MAGTPFAAEERAQRLHDLLSECAGVLESLPPDALGIGGEGGATHWHIRDVLVGKIRAALELGGSTIPSHKWHALAKVVQIAIRVEKPVEFEVEIDGRLRGFTILPDEHPEESG